jgi:SAM-dependent methyltransferase
MLPRDPQLLELGEAELYVDVSMARLSESIEELVTDEVERDRLQQRLVDIITANAPTRSWDLAKLLYQVVLDCRRVVSIDFHGTPAARPLDLNYPVDLGGQFDIVFNPGTAEHIFDVCRFFRTVHEVTRPGGVMVHAAPFRGWLEHGFYNFNPGFFWDLAGANGYSVILIAYTEADQSKVVPLTGREHIIRLARDGGLGSNAMLEAILRKSDAETEFRVPTQAVYAGTLNDEMRIAWKTER